MTRLAADTVLDGRYQVIEHLGTGGMAEVYFANDLQLGRKVALKLLHDRFAQDAEFVERFRREASSAAGLQHQHVVSVYDRGECDGTSYIAMEYVAGRTLKQLVREDGPLDPARAADLTVQILRAARFAHRRGVIHRDFKPQNVIVDEDGRAKVTDFGIARAGASDMTQTGSIMGTAQYLSPEQAQGHAVNARSDLYSIGIILYELLTGRVPFDAESAVTVALKQVSETPIAPSERNPAVTPELEAVVLRAIAKDPDRSLRRRRRVHRRSGSRELPDPLAGGDRGGRGGSRVASARARAGGARRRPPPPDATGVLPVGEPVRREPVTVVPGPAAPARRSRRWPWLALAALVVVGLVVAVVMLAVPSRVPVPSVVGSSISVATQRLRSEGFKVEIVRDTSDKPRNTVVGQDPGGGETADEGVHGDAQHLRRARDPEGPRRRRRRPPGGAPRADGRGLRGRRAPGAVRQRADRPGRRAVAVGQLAGRARPDGHDRGVVGPGEGGRARASSGSPRTTPARRSSGRASASRSSRARTRSAIRAPSSSRPRPRARARSGVRS